MGNLIRKVEVCGLGAQGGVKKCVLVNAIVDTGATKTVITPELAAHVDAAATKMHSKIEGRKVPISLTAMKLQEKGCDYTVIPAAVDAKISARAGVIDGKRIDVILGHDYLQEHRVNVSYGDRAENHSVRCGRGRK